MTIDYQQPDAARPTTHDHIYTSLLAALAFLLMIGIGTLIWMRQLPRTSTESKAALLLPMIVESFYLAAIVLVLFIRIVAPKTRRWPTFTLNIVLFLFFPLGTALAVYGLRRIDKNLKPMPTAGTN
jgi:hypothetical protein